MAQENNDRIKLVADKSEYEVGDTAEILVPSPYQGKVKALLTTERGQVLSAEVIELAGNSEVIKLPITAEDAPNVFVSLVLMKGMDKATPLASFKIGLVAAQGVGGRQGAAGDPHAAQGEVTSPTTAATATGGVTPPLQVAPRDTVTWDVLTLDAAGKPVPAEVSLALVDKAVLTLADDQAGKLMDRFYVSAGWACRPAPRWCSTSTASSPSWPRAARAAAVAAAAPRWPTSAANSRTSPTGGPVTPAPTARRRCR